MTLSYKQTLFLPLLVSLILLSGCRHTGKSVANPLFEVIPSQSSGLDFSNNLSPTPAFNVLDYMYYYNGAGVAAGDFNGDGRIDLFFNANQGKNKLFLNEGNMTFKDVTDEAHIPQDSGWSTGVSVVDINNDGLLDIYICKVGKLEGLPTTHNQLLICTGIDKGIPSYQDESEKYGLNFTGFSTQAVFFDYDNDGDLDMYLLNHTLHQNGTFGPRKDKLAIPNAYSGDRLFQNNGNGTFTDVTAASGIHSSILGYGLGIAVSDINLDGSPDIYVANDFHENDYLYINQKNGTFADETDQHLMHTSHFSMGVDIADVNNDAYPEIISMDMLAYDPSILKRSQGEDTWDIFNMKIEYGYNYQYTRNNLQLNRRNGQFSEIGLYSGVAATDWSWSPLWMDFDNDGKKDLFISNGIPSRLNDIDFINFLSNQELLEKMHGSGLDEQDIKMLNKFPEIKLPSKFYKNTGDMKFADLTDQVDGSFPTYSNGAVYADLDGDGDLDLVVNSIDAPAILYRNTSNDKNRKDFVDLRLKGPANNKNALGAKAILFTGNEIRTYEKYPVRGFLSSMEIPLHIGLDKTTIDSLFLIWPDNTFQRIERKKDDTSLSLTWQPSLPRFDYSKLTRHYKNQTTPVKDITASTGLLYKHHENSFHEFNREPLLPHMLSTEGPALAIGDLNKDGLPDVFIGSSKREKSALFIQGSKGTFTRTPESSLDKDSVYEDVDACFADVNQDGNMDLVVASGGNEFYGEDTMLTPRVYLGNGKGQLTKRQNAFDKLFINASCITACDFDGDGKQDLFVGGRSIPFNYGQHPKSYLLKGDGTGHFTDVTAQFAPGLSDAGFVTHALWIDLDKNGKQDLILTLEWGGIVAFLNQGNNFTKTVVSDKRGWWNFILPVDLNNDGNIDFIAGNLGENSRLTASAEQPVRLYYYDFDDNGKKDQILTYYLNGKEIPFADKMELEKQIPSLKKRFLYAEDFAKAKLEDLFTKDKLQKADTLTADFLSNAVLLNDGHNHFTTQALPWQAQLSTYRDAVVVNANNDSLPDILLTGNYYGSNIQMGRYDADYGTLLINKGNGKFETSTLNGLAIKGEVRHILPIHISGQAAGNQTFILARNNDSTMLIQFHP